MLIEGPFKFGIKEKENTIGRELHLEFTLEFRDLPQEAQTVSLKDYIRELQNKILGSAKDSADKQGMLIIQQVAEQLLPHITAGEFPLNETVVIEIQSESTLRRFIPVRQTIN